MQTEIVIQTNTELVDLREDQKRYKPQGAIVAVKTPNIKMRKWMEIAFSHAAPENRQKWVNSTPLFQLFIDNWRKEFRDKWFDLDRQKVFSDPVSGPLDTAAFWNQYIVDTGLKKALGKDTRGQVDLMETWVWGSLEKTTLLPAVVNTGSNISTKIKEVESQGILYKVKEKKVQVIHALLNAGVTEEEYLNIVNKAVPIETDFDRPVLVDYIVDSEVPS